MILRFLALALLVPAAALAQAPSIQSRAEAKLAEAPKGTRIGLVVADEAGREIVSILPDQRFIPASNTKMVTTATAFATIGDLTKPDPAGGTQVMLAGRDVTLRKPSA
jgi:serine-type D-Ala-D-Ala carboxypeptidase/endopeptidase (penicillin-binding protein 4)